MKHSARPFMLCGMALASIALGPSAAYGTTPVELINESTHVQCDPCTIEVEGEAHLNLFGGRVSSCEVHLVIALDEDGTGSSEYTNENHHDPPPPAPCTRIACNGVGEAAGEHTWDITGTEEDGPGHSEMVLQLCLDAASNPNGTGTHCVGDVIVTDIGSHGYLFTRHHQCLGGLIELESEWTITGGDPLEIVHL